MRYLPNSTREKAGLFHWRAHRPVKSTLAYAILALAAVLAFGWGMCFGWAIAALARLL